MIQQNSWKVPWCQSLSHWQLFPCLYLCRLYLGMGTDHQGFHQDFGLALNGLWPTYPCQWQRECLECEGCPLVREVQRQVDKLKHLGTWGLHHLSAQRDLLHHGRGTAREGIGKYGIHRYSGSWKQAACCLLWTYGCLVEEQVWRPGIEWEGVYTSSRKGQAMPP